MATKIEIIGNALVVTDTVTNKTIGESPKRLVYFNSHRLEEDDTIEIIDINSQDSVQNSWQALPIGDDVIDSTDTAFTVATFKTFARTNLGS